MAKDNMQELTTERDIIAGTVPHQYRSTIRINYLRPRTVILALAAVGAGIIWLLRFLGRTAR